MYKRVFQAWNHCGLLDERTIPLGCWFSTEAVVVGCDINELRNVGLYTRDIGDGLYDDIEYAADSCC